MTLKKLALMGLLALLAVLFTHFYMDTTYMLPQSQVSFHARLMITSPFVYRLLIPYVLGWVLPAGWLDAFSLKFAFSVASVWLTLYLMPAFTRRLCGLELKGARALALLGLVMAILVCHYCLPRPFMFYYIYDLPAIPFYMVAFLLLTRQVGVLSLAGVAFLLVASVNRETVVIALCHALAWHLVQLAQSAPPAQGGASCWSVWRPLLWQSAVALGLMALIRAFISHQIQAAGDGNAAFMEGEHIRVLINIQRVLTQDLHARALLLFGCGALVWLPWGLMYMPRVLRWVALSSLPPMLLLLVVGNMVELRIYGEFVPVLAVGLYAVLAALVARFRPGTAAAT